jgi:hypothetical protein
MDFVVGLPKAPDGQDSSWVVIDRLTKSAHFIPFHITVSVPKLAEMYIRDIVRLHGGLFLLQRFSFYFKILEMLTRRVGNEAEY